MIPTIRPLVPFIVGVALCAVGCSTTQGDPDQNSPGSTDPAVVVITDGVTTTTTEPSVTQPAVSSTTSMLTTPPDTTLAKVEETVPSTNPTTTTSIETLMPDVETFEPEAPQTGFVTHEPNA